MSWDVRCQLSGDSAEAECQASALLAADTLARDISAALGTQGSLRAAQRSLLLLREGQYEGRATQLAREGRKA